MRRDPLRKAHAVPVFTDAFLATMHDFKGAITRTRNVRHNPTKGAMRESPIAKFFQDRIPSVYGVASGEVVDLENRSSPQFDVMFYDQTCDFPFVSDQALVLASEALLASIEVKSRLNSDEVSDCLKKARKLRQLRPFTNALAGLDIEDPARSKRQARYFHAVFAYDTDLVTETWAKHEYERFSKGNSKDHQIDIVYVLGRGLLYLNDRKVVFEDDSTAHAFSIFYFSILNFLNRESRRRGETPYASYAAKMGGIWKRIR
jgi:hypothetical protein